MLIDTHCHINMIVKKEFDVPLSKDYKTLANPIIRDAINSNVTKIINIGTSLIESQNCVQIAKDFSNCFAGVGIHPNDLTSNWKKDLKNIKKILKIKKENKIIAIGESGIDKHYTNDSNYNLQRQKDGFKAQIELALEHDLALSVHSRDAYDETLEVLEEFKNNNLRGVIHCFSEDLNFANQAISWGFVLGIGGTLTYPKNNLFREIIKNININNIILETDAPFLPPQIIRGKTNYPKYIKYICEYLAELKKLDFNTLSKQININTNKIFGI